MRGNHDQRLGVVRFLMVMMAFLLLPIPGQAAPAGQPETAGFAPFATRLKAQVIDYQVKLTWKDSPDVKGLYVVYRSPEEITSQSFAKALLLAKVDAGVEFFVDTPPDQKGYFYAVIVQDAAGTLYPVLIPYRNKTSVAAAGQTAAPEEELAARISGIKARVSSVGDGVDVTFTSSSPTRDLLLFWGTGPLSRSEDLLASTSTMQLDQGTTRCFLPVFAGVDYWFAVLDAGLYKIGQITLVNGANTTIAPVQIPVTAGTVATAPPSAQRPMPLPSLAVTLGAQSGQQLTGPVLPELPEKIKVSAATEKSIRLLMKNVQLPAVKERTRQVLPSDATPMPGGELARLQAIVTGPFIEGDIAGAARSLMDFLRMPRAAPVEARARYYLGQTYYFQGKAREALMEFILSEDYYYPEAQPWKDACFEKLEHADEGRVR
ncbi:MAG: hypothetical protein ABSB63_03980 [Spirochaetia bacterium]